MHTSSEQADLMKLRRKSKKLGYYIRKIPKKLYYLGDYAVMLNSCGGIIFTGSIEDIQDYLARELA